MTTMLVGQRILRLLCIGAALGPTSAHASLTKVVLAPYVWAPTINGQVALGPLVLPIRATPRQLASGVRAGLMGSATVEKGRVFLATEIIAVDFQRNQFAPVLSQNVEARAISIEGVAGYAVPLGKSLELRPFAGVRYNNLKVNVGVAPVNLSVKADWAEPLLGGSVMLRPNGKWTLTAKIDRGLGGSTRNSFNVRGDVDYRLGDRFSLFGGYRHTAQYYTGDAAAPFTIDLRGDGPIVGVRGRF